MSTPDQREGNPRIIRPTPNYEWGLPLPRAEQPGYSMTCITETTLLMDRQDSLALIWPILEKRVQKL